MVPADADTEAEPTTRQEVQVSGLAGNERRLPLREDEHAGHELEASREPGGVREHHEGIVKRILFRIRTGEHRIAPLVHRAQNVVIGKQVVETESLRAGDDAPDGLRVAA